MRNFLHGAYGRQDGSKRRDFNDKTAKTPKFGRFCPYESLVFDLK